MSIAINKRKYSIFYGENFIIGDGWWLEKYSNLKVFNGSNESCVVHYLAFFLNLVINKYLTQFMFQDAVGSRRQETVFEI